MAVKDNDMFVNIYTFRNSKYPFQFFIGGRGTGKTYSGLGGAVEGEVQGKFMYSRMTDKEYKVLLDVKGVEGGNPFKKYNHKNGTNYGLSRINSSLAGIYNRETNSDGLLIPNGQPIGYGSSLYGIADLRSIDFFDVSDWLLDEFVPEKHKRALPDAASAFFNAYETINRNREIEEEELPPVNVWAMSNSNNIYNDMFKGLGVVADIEKAVRKGRTDLYYSSRGLAIHLLPNSPIFEEKKKKTALYKLTKGTAFYDMALSNKFAYDDFSLVEYKRLTGWHPVVSIVHGDIEYTVYRKKGEKYLHATYYRAKYCPKFNVNHVQDAIGFKREYGNYMFDKFTNGLLTFESYELKCELLDLLTIKV